MPAARFLSTPSRLLRGGLLLAAAALCAAPAFSADPWKQVLDLRGQWKFELGDDSRRAVPEFDDRKWADIFVPAAWEDEGYPGYDGYAWYRKRFTLPNDARGKTLYLHLGYIDDVSEVWLNGRKVGFSGAFPPNLMTAYNQYQQYPVPAEWVRWGQDNVLSVRVYDMQLSGGMIHGRVGFFEPTDRPPLAVSLEGMWRFATGDGMERKEPAFDDRGWKELLVPGFWETQGFQDYDGFGWYRRTFRVPAGFTTGAFVLLMGRIDDIDEVYLNGTRIGQTGRMGGKGKPGLDGDEYKRLRAYTVPQGALRRDGENVLAVRVYDGLVQGGIYDGPVGFLTQEDYRRWKKRQPDEKKEGWDVFDILFGR